MAAALAEAEARLAAAGVPSPAADAEVLTAHCLGTDRTGLIVRLREPMPERGSERLGTLVDRRLRREPVQHLVGEWEFLGLRLRTDARALIPRPETEELVEAVLRRLPRDVDLRIADVGTGTGCLALAVAAERPRARVTAIDISAEALDLARENVARHGLGERVTLVRGDLLEPVPAGAGLDAIVSNPPYVADGEVEGLPPEVRDFEPAVALSCGATGLETTLRLIEQAPSRLRPGGLLAIECAFSRAAPVARALETAFRDVELLPDIAGIPRMALAVRTEDA